MININTHIIPGIDEGIQTIEDSIELAEAAVREGISTIVATPAYQEGINLYSKREILTQVEDLNKHLQKRQINLTVLPGQIISIYGDLLDDIKHNQILTINKDTPYILLELPKDHVPQYTSNLFFNLQMEGYIPIIAQPERNKQIQQNPNLLYKLIKHGAYAQLSAGSICGKYGKKISKLSHQFIEANLIHLIASDSRGNKRKFHMRTASNIINRKYGYAAGEILTENAQQVIKGTPIISAPPEYMKRKKLLPLFN
ncbi:tyrosine-protein phosphatase [Halobacillus sp. Marseille-P3879]|uniref:tyrosine-protein phosphatase n=1 Tax=Halobacillus sp. Marseille-P3879 TaxID=2045014 RepID=UPI000C7C6ACD|nr:CpsB/CapC family capsule biosynthesis tyrosine phosphatase [Halobacillus sp. Marseille-P3879]